MDVLSAIRSFVRVVETGAFARAAERLQISTSAVSRHVTDLEAHLEARLLNRTTRRIALTDVGQAYFERCVQLLADLEEAEGSVRAASVLPRGTLRLTCGVTFGIRYLAPALVEFVQRHPQIVLDLDLSDRAVDLIEEGFDLAIRIGAIGQQGLISRRIGSTSLILCASPAYLAGRRKLPLRKPEDLTNHECLTYTQVPVPNIWRFQGVGGDLNEVRIKPQHRANNGRMLVELAAQGLGIVFEPDFIVAPEIESGRLVRLLPKFQAVPSSIAAVYPSRRHLSAKVRTIVEFLAQRFGQAPSWQLR